MPIEETAIPNKDNVPIGSRESATCRLSTVSEDLANALGKQAVAAAMCHAPPPAAP